MRRSVRLGVALCALAALTVVPGAFGTTTGSPFTANDPSFGSVNVGSTPTSTVTIVNGDSVDHTIDVGGLAVSGLDAGLFTLSNSTCGGTTLTASGGSCTVDVTFAPTAGAGAGAKTAQIDVSYDGTVPATTQTDVSDLSGTAVIPAPVASVPGTLVFGGVKTGTTASRTLTVQNTGNAALHITTVGKSGSAAITVPQATNGCRNSTVAAGSSCQMTVNLAATTSVLTYNATITITDDAAGSPQTVAVSGTLLSQYVTLSPVTITSTVVLGHSSAVHTVTLTNLSSNPLAVTGFTKTGKNPNAFALGNDQCSGQSVPAGGTCTLTVVYNATAAGTQTVQINETDDAPDTTHVLVVSARGARPPAVTGLRAVSSCTAVAMTWTKPNYGGLVTTRVVRNLKRIPRTPTDGTVVSHPAGHLTNTGLKRLTTYHYGVWATYRFKAGGPLYYSARVAVNPHLGRICAPGNNARIANLRPTIRWSGIANGRAYGIRLFNHGKQVYSWFKLGKHLSTQIPASWHQNGVTRKLQHGQSYTILLYGYTTAKPRGYLIGRSGFHVN